MGANMFKHILIPTDGSRLSEKAIHAGVKMARLHGAKVTGFFAAPAPTPLVYGDFMPVGYLPPDQHETLIQKATKHHLAVIEKAAHEAGVEVNTQSVTSDFPADAILEAARQQHCDLIFMASHGRRGLAGILLGSETQKVLTSSRIPVLVFR
jgi:nucleotide-binding universal stress UspA family protein